MPDRGAPTDAAAGVQSGIADLGQALRLRQRAAARRRARRLLAVFGLVVVLAVVVCVCLFSPLLKVRDIRVQGISLLSADTVTAAAQVSVGQPLARIDTDTVADRVAAIPEVASVTVRRSWPHTLTIDITERQPVLQRDVSSGGVVAYQWVDAQGVVFHTDATRLSVPLLTSTSQDQALLAEVAQVLAAVPSDIAPLVTSMSATSQDAVSLSLSDGRTIVWGSADQSALKAQVIEVLLKQPGTIYDVSAPGHPAVR